jgi:DNA-binding transcriptional LysR family regulator
MRNLDLDQVRAFLVVADLRGFSAAGEMLGATQSAISLRIAKLEQHLGKRLLARSPRSVALTPHGHQFLAFAREIILAHDRALANMDGIATETTTLRLAISDHAVGAKLSNALVRLRASAPQHVLDVTVGLSAEMRAVYDAGEADAAIVRQDADRREGVHLFSDPLVWVSAKNDQATFNYPVNLVALRGPCGVKAAMTKALDEARIPWRMSFQSGSTMALQAAVEAGIGISAFGKAHIPESGMRVTKGLPSLPPGRVVLHTRLPMPLRGMLAAAFKGAIDLENAPSDLRGGLQRADGGGDKAPSHRGA